MPSKCPGYNLYIDGYVKPFLLLSMEPHVAIVFSLFNTAHPIMSPVFFPLALDLLGTNVRQDS